MSATSDDIRQERQTARVFRFHGTEADSELPPITIGMPRSYGDDRRRVPGAERFFVDDAVPEPMSDDELEEAADDWPTTRRFARSAHGVDAAWRDSEYADPIERFARSSFEQDKQVESLSHKWAFRVTCAIGLGLLIWLAFGWLK